MTEQVIPESGSLVELSAGGDPISGVRVVLPAGAPPGTVTLSLALTDVPQAGAGVTLRWPAGPRGRHVLPCRVDSIDENRVRLVPAGRSGIEQLRSFVRGGGGEQIMLRREGHLDVLGWVRDLSEQGVRAHYEDANVTVGETVRIRMQLDDLTVDVAAVTSKVASLRQSLPRRGPVSVEVVAVLDPDDRQATVIRRYVMRQQLLTRTRTAG